MTPTDLIKARDCFQTCVNQPGGGVYFDPDIYHTILWALSQCIDPWNTNMDEAPKDGQFMLFTGDSEDEDKYIGFWNKNEKSWCAWYHCCYYAPKRNPTAWMPLPAPKENK